MLANATFGKCKLNLEITMVQQVEPAKNPYRNSCKQDLEWYEEKQNHKTNQHLFR